MIRLGKVYKNRMIDLSVSNSKLLDRSIRIIQDLTNINRSEALELLKITDGSVKLSILMALTDSNLEVAEKTLLKNKNRLDLSIENIMSENR